MWPFKKRGEPQESPVVVPGNPPFLHIELSKDGIAAIYVSWKTEDTHEGRVEQAARLAAILKATLSGGLNTAIADSITDLGNRKNDTWVAQAVITNVWPNQLPEEGPVVPPTAFTLRNMPQ